MHDDVANEDTWNEIAETLDEPANSKIGVEAIEEHN